MAPYLTQGTAEASGPGPLVGIWQQASIHLSIETEGSKVGGTQRRCHQFFMPRERVYLFEKDWIMKEKLKCFKTKERKLYNMTVSPMIKNFVYL